MAVRKPPMCKLPSERIATILEEMRKMAKGARKPDVLADIYAKYHYDNIVCLNLAKNTATPTEVREKLAKHNSKEIRLEAATWSDLINDESVLKKLALDFYEIRWQVARSTLNDSIKELLYRTNPQHEDIRKMCIKRLTNMEKLEKIIFNKKPEITLNQYLNSVMSNRHLNRRIALLVLKYAEKLSDEQIDLIVELIQNDRNSTGEMLDKISKE